jgi:23S rRNA (uracil1939-C5)-methyltransferase
VTVERLGARGDGIARGQGRPLYLPLTLPGDRVRARPLAPRGEGWAGELLELLEGGPGRAAPPCRHFGSCGGCAWQHLDDPLYAETKRRLVVDALAHHGLGGAPVDKLLRIAPGTRRRAAFKFGAARAGFNARASHSLVDVAECAVLVSPLLALLPRLRALGAALLASRESADASATLTDTGIDLLLDLPRAPDLSALERLALLADDADLARLSWRAPGEGEAVPVAVRRPPRIVHGGVAVELPPGGFLQASKEAEAAMQDAVLAAVGEARRIADLFAGIGTFALPLAGRASVRAAEGWRPAASALAAAARRAGLALEVETRDLEARPLGLGELAGFDAVVLDPPRAGAKAQSAELARSAVPIVVAVSCNPATFARDARTLVDGGYRLESVVPIDQFVWSPHVELVAVLRR